MGRIKQIELSAARSAALEQGYQQGHSAAFRRRCQMLLLKSQGHTSRQVAEIVGSCEMSVRNWVHRYQDQGIAGLQTKAGRGRGAGSQSHLESHLEGHLARR